MIQYNQKARGTQAAVSPPVISFSQSMSEPVDSAVTVRVSLVENPSQGNDDSTVSTRNGLMTITMEFFERGPLSSSTCYYDPYCMEFCLIKGDPRGHVTCLAAVTRIRVV